MDFRYADDEDANDIAVFVRSVSFIEEREVHKTFFCDFHRNETDFAFVFL